MAGPLLLVALHEGHFNKARASTGTYLQAEKTRLDDGYRNAAISAADLAQHIRLGRAWVGCHLDPHPQGKGGWRHSDAAGSANLIVLDVDGDLTLEEFWAKPFCQKHCLFTATSCSHQITDANHPVPQDRFRAVFHCETHDPDIHPFIYQQLLARLGWNLQDDSGLKPERLWYGNNRSEIREGEGLALDWEIITDAADAMANRPEPEKPVAQHDDDFGIDCKRAAYVLNHILRTSEDGEYNSYWISVYNSAASSGDEEVWEAFLDWHARGHHSKKNRPQRLERDRHKAGRRSNIGVILKHAKDQQGADWWKRLPRELQYGQQRSDFPRKFYVASHARGDVPDTRPADRAPDTVPSPHELSNLKLFAYHRNLKTGEDKTAVSHPLGDYHETTKLVDMLYHCVVHQEQLNEQGEYEAIPSELDALDLESEIRSRIYEQNTLYCREPHRLQSYLFRRFLIDQGFPHFSSKNRRLRTLAEPPPAPTTYLIPGLIAQRRTYLLYGKGGSGKTTLALALARAVLGFPGHESFLDFPAVPDSRWQSMRVLYIATDGHADAYTDLWNYAHQHGMGNQEWAKEYFHVIAMHAEEHASAWTMELKDIRYLIDVLQAAVDEGKPYGMVIFDSLKSVCPQNVLVRDPIVLEYVNALGAICARFQAAALLVHHQSKETDSAQGVTGLTEQVAGVFRLKRDPEKGHIFVVEKTRAGALPRNEIPYTLSGSSLIATEDEEEDGSDSATSSEIRERCIEKELRYHFNAWKAENVDIPASAYSREYRGLAPKAIHELIELAGHACSECTFRRALSALENAGKIQSLGLTRQRTYRVYLGEDPTKPTLDDLDSVPGF